MANSARAVLESALRERKLDQTLTTALAPLEQASSSALVPLDVAALDACLHGGLPRGQLSELVGACSSGRTTLLLQLIAAATQRGEIAALVDTCDRLDVASAATAGVALDRLLWIRGFDASGTDARSPVPGARRPWPGVRLETDDWRPETGAAPVVGRLVDRALKALNLVLQAGGFDIVAIDLADVPHAVLRQVPFTTWLRVQRALEGSETACVLLAAEPLARSAGGLTLSLAARSTWVGSSPRSRHLDGTDVRVRVVSPRKRIDGDVTVHAVTGDHLSVYARSLRELRDLRDLRGSNPRDLRGSNSRDLRGSNSRGLRGRAL